MFRRITPQKHARIIQELLEEEVHVEPQLSTSRLPPESVFASSINSPLHEEPDYKALYFELFEKKSELTERIKELEERQLKREKEFEKLTSEHIALDQIVHKILSKNQIDLLSKAKKKVRWTRDEIATAFTLRYLSVRAYLFVRNKMLIPQPGIVRESYNLFVFVFYNF
jgi:hypothetical protein